MATASLTQAWDDSTFCENYASTWEISIDEVHYGWLAPGEATIGLLSNIDLQGAVVLDAGCGMGHNLIALARQGANCFGIDISPCMLQKALCLTAAHGINNGQIEYAHDDMRILSEFPKQSFDIILSVYSLEYVRGISELKATVYRFFQKLNPGGTLIICFSHPSQVRRHPTLINNSVPVGVFPTPTYNFSFKDVVNTLCKTGFSVERIIEQQTKNPSLITYEESLIFPYHFHKGNNPCLASFDEISNSDPHSIIYKVKKPMNPVRGIPLSLKSGMNTRRIWGSRRSIVENKCVSYLYKTYKAQFFAPIDNVAGLCDVLKICIQKTGDNSNQEIVIDLDDEEFIVKGDSVLGVVHKALNRDGLQPIYKPYTLEAEDGRMMSRIILDGILGLDDEMEETFRGCELGLLIFLNDEEPCQGELGVDEVYVEVSDNITLTYVAIQRKSDRLSPQLTLI